MRFSTSTLLIISAFLASSANAFSAVAPTSKSTPATGGDAIDKTLQGINVGDEYDPTSGDSPPLTRNNLDQVWVPQVRFLKEQMNL